MICRFSYFSTSVYSPGKKQVIIMKTPAGTSKCIMSQSASVPVGIYPSAPGTMCFWSINRVMARGVWLDSMPGCNCLKIQTQPVHPRFWLVPFLFVCFRPMFILTKRCLPIALFETRTQAKSLSRSSANGVQGRDYLV